MNVIDFPLCLRNFFCKLFQPIVFASIRQFMPSVFHMAMIYKSQVGLGSDVCIFFQKGTSAYSSCPDKNIEPKKIKEKLAGSKTLPASIQEKRHIGPKCREESFHRRKKITSFGGGWQAPAPDRDLESNWFLSASPRIYIYWYAGNCEETQPKVSNNQRALRDLAHSAAHNVLQSRKRKAGTMTQLA